MATVKIHPSVILSIVDGHDWRPKRNNRVIGILMGKADKFTIEVTDCFRITHHDVSDAIQLDRPMVERVMNLHRLCFSDEEIVGWFSTQDEVVSNDMNIQSYFRSVCRQVRTHSNCPILLTVGCDAEHVKNFEVKAYHSATLGGDSQGVNLGTVFIPLPVSITTYTAEKAALDTMFLANNNFLQRVTPLPNDFTQMISCWQSLDEMLDSVVQFIQDVLDGRAHADGRVGRMLSELVHSVPQLKPEHFESVINASMKDLLMVVYLYQLTKTPTEICNAVYSV